MIFKIHDGEFHAAKDLSFPFSKQFLQSLALITFSMAALMDSGLSVGLNRAMTLPCLSTRNLVKFHLMLVVPRMPFFSAEKTKQM